MAKFIFICTIFNGIWFCGLFFNDKWTRFIIRTIYFCHIIRNYIYKENGGKQSAYNVGLKNVKVNFNSIEEKSNYINSVLKETSKINDPIRVEIILKGLAKEYDIGYNTLESRLLGYKENRVENTPKITNVVKKTDKKDKYQGTGFQKLWCLQYISLSREKGRGSSAYSWYIEVFFSYIDNQTDYEDSL